MSSQPLLRGLFAAALVVAAGYGLLSTRAVAALPWGGACLDQTGCSLCCPVCDHVCKLDAEQVEEDIPCFEVESKVICIPRVVFPWQKKQCNSCDACDGKGCTNCVHNGARVRRICVLKTDKIKCPKCKYTWSAEKRGAGCDRGCVGPCDEACDTGCDASIPTEWQRSLEYQASESPGMSPVPLQAVEMTQPQPPAN